MNFFTPVPDMAPRTRKWLWLSKCHPGECRKIFRHLLVTAHTPSRLIATSPARSGFWLLLKCKFIFIIHHSFNENLARNEMEGGSTERHFKGPTRLNEPQGKIKI